MKYEGDNDANQSCTFQNNAEKQKNGIEGIKNLKKNWECQLQNTAEIIKNA